MGTSFQPAHAGQANSDVTYSCSRPAIGQSGIGVQAVDHIRDAVAQLTRESDRSKKLRRLRLAKPVSEPGSAVAALQKACGALAGVLMGNNVSGDVRSAAELVCWAGGVPARNRPELRELFDQQLKTHRNSVTKTLFTELERLGLVSKKKSLKELLFG
ncbi:hypothetical protein MTY66_48750 [Mycolicibacterium sp. TY66]|uniref:hypothetical protein n=1 Tax=unclassified Mycolicibacterium TaxID=2636767 RepID=UPI001BB30824|nr:MULTISPECIES: hypothetical protein [unclassified Mycolicibacterium]BCI83250.1 hypothetical protein MTY66_48750 [Mycolicibacterium sp. TY66]BCJ79104.1 hypothetical protein MTY81_04770 [Mycolicibacterium sp. TY81]